MMTLSAAQLTHRIAVNLIRAREAAGLSQSEAGLRLDPPISRHEISKYERAERRPREYRLFSLADAYGVDVGYFYTEHEEAA